MLNVALAAGVVGVQRMVEAWLSSRNRIYLLAQGGREYGAGHYRAVCIIHGAWLAALVVEGLYKQAALSTYWVGWCGLFVAAQVIRYWCILTLGHCWNTRVIVIKGAKRIRRGPYQFFSHPNYIAVCVELMALPLIFDAQLTAFAACLAQLVWLFGWRLPVERRALQQLQS